MEINCKYCESVFTQKNNMYRHIKTACKSPNNPKNIKITETVAQEKNDKDMTLIFEKIEELKNIIEDMKKKFSSINIDNSVNIENSSVNIENNIIYFNNKLDVFELMEKKLTTEGAVYYYLHDLPSIKDTSPVVFQIIEEHGSSCPIKLSEDGDLLIYNNKDSKEPIIDRFGNYLNKQTAYLCLLASHKAYSISAKNAPDSSLYPQEYQNYLLNGKGNHPSLEKWSKDKDIILSLGEKNSGDLMKLVKNKLKLKLKK